MSKKEQEPDYKSQIKQRANKSSGLRQQCFEKADKDNKKDE